MDTLPFLIVFAVALVAGSCGLLIGRVRRGGLRLSLLAALLISPVVLVSLALVTIEPPASGGIWLWWCLGMARLALPAALWAMLCAGAYFIGRRGRLGAR
jgi:hypothetical protein